MGLLQNTRYKGAVYGLAAAALFGLGLPLAKLLLPEATPLLIAGLLYSGAGVGLLVFEQMFYRRSKLERREAKVGTTDRWLLTGIIISGGILGPVCMLWGLNRTTGVLGSLLLNLEAPLTIVLAVTLFREHLGRMEAAGALLIFVAAAFLHFRPSDLGTDAWGFLSIASACLFWALDNNLSQRLSLRDPIVVTRIKALSAGICMLSLAGAVDQTWPRPLVSMAALGLGFFSYGMSLLLDMHALRLHGAAREAGYFATAPFIGALAAVPILGESWEFREALATMTMVLGIVLLVRAHHSHLHFHDEMEHAHVHVHADHHDHQHEEAGTIEEPHAHLHYHLPLAHDHHHVSDAHHRHNHG